MVRAQSRVPLAILGAGTGNDFAKSLGAPTRDFRAMAALIAAGSFRVVDAGRIDSSVFLNSGGFGFDAEVVAKTQQPGRWRSKSVYTATALRELFRYPGFNARISHAVASSAPGTPQKTFRSSAARGDASPQRESLSVTGTHTTDGHWLTMVFANGAWFGGSYRIAPDASISDGVLDAVLISDASTWRRAVLFGRALGAWHVREREVAVQRNTRWIIDFPSAPVYQADGELRQAAGRSVVVEILPAALRLVAPAATSP